MRTDHVIHRIHVQRLLLAAALLGVSLGASAISRGTDRARGQAVWDAAVNGKTTTVGGGNGSMTVITPYKPSTVDANGNVALQTGPGNVNVNGQSVPVSVSGTVGKGDIANAALAAASCAVGGGGVAGAVVCGGAAIAIPIAMNWIANAGLRVNPTTKELEKAPNACAQVQCDEYSVFPQTVGWKLSAAAACPVGHVFKSGDNTTFGGDFRFRVTGLIGADRCGYDMWQGGSNPMTGPPFTSSSSGVSTRKVSGDPSLPWLSASLADATGLMNNSRIPSGDIVRELDMAGQADKMPASDIRVTGPSAVQGPSTTSVTNNSTTTTTTTNTSTTNNYTYNTNNITNSSSVTNTTSSTAVKNADGTTTTTTNPPTTTTTTTNPGDAAPAEPEDPPTQCDKFPNSLGCAELDTPTGTIPRETKNVTFQAEDVLGGGQCPADVMTTLSTLDGRSVKIVDWTTFCGMAIPVRLLVLALASIMAFFIIMPGGVRE